LLLLFFLFRVTGSLLKSSFVAALFALHPLHVESVAWVAERKDVLSAFFWFLTLIFYAEYVVKRKPALYMLSLLSFVLGLMSKPMLVTLPIVMLLMDFWPLDRDQYEKQEQRPHQVLGRVQKFIIEKVPFFFFSFLSAVVTIYAQNKGGAIKSFDVIPIGFRLENALIAYVKYIIKTLWPHDLAVLYPIPIAYPPWQVIGSLILLLLISGATIWGHRHRYLAVGWFWFLVTLVPVLGLIQVGGQSMADRYSYIPVIGLFIIAAWGVTDLTRNLPHQRVILAILAGAIIIASATLTWQQLGYWQDTISLYRHTLQVTTNNGYINYNLGTALAEKGDMDEAAQEFREALRTYPDFKEAHINLGVALASKGFLDEAIKEYRLALCISPNDADAHKNLRQALASKGDVDAEIHEYQEEIRINPNDIDAHYNLGVTLASKGYQDAAVQEFQAVLRINPNDAKAHVNLGIALANKGLLGPAIQEFQEALRISPNDTKAKSNLEIALTQKRTNLQH
jgi:tetratricopeptide (TPR) repeat protein